jgi:hypothetical protein
VAAWAGWGAGPAGAGSAGGPSRAFLTVALVGSAVVAGVLVRDGAWPQAFAAAVAVVYFSLRLFGGLGRRRKP